MEMKFRCQKYFQVFNIFGTGYRGLTKFILIDKCGSFLEKDIT
jgi:hypothetical protein